MDFIYLFIFYLPAKVEEEQTEESLQEETSEENPLEKDVTPTDHVPDDHPPDDPLRVGPSPQSRDTHDKNDDPKPIKYNDHDSNMDSDPDDPDPTFSDPDNPPEVPREGIKSCIVMDAESSSEENSGSEMEDGHPSRKNVARRGGKKGTTAGSTTGGDSPNSGSLGKMYFVKSDFSSLVLNDILYAQ